MTLKTISISFIVFSMAVLLVSTGRNRTTQLTPSVLYVKINFNCERFYPANVPLNFTTIGIGYQAAIKSTNNVLAPLYGDSFCVVPVYFIQ